MLTKETDSVTTWTFYDNAARTEDSVLTLSPTEALASGTVPIGLCRTLQEGDAACFYDFEINPALRGKGLGKRALAVVLQHLTSEGITKVFLHVSGDNLPAVRLYRDFGFEITESLEYWIY